MFEPQKKVIISLGCSWTVGHEIEDEFTGFADSEEVRCKYRYAEQLRQMLDYDEHVIYGMCGGSNECAIRLMYDGIFDYIDSGYKILLTFGVTSAWRTELFDVSTNRYIGFIYGNEEYFTINPDLVPLETKRFVHSYKVRTSDVDAMRTKQSAMLLGLHSFLTVNKIEHVFFKIFNPYYPRTVADLIPDRNYIWRHDLPLNEQLTDDLRAAGAHPNVRGHTFLAEKLHKHLTEGNYDI